MKTTITSVPVGTKFNYNDETFVVVERNYPWIYAKCISEPNDYEGLEIQFGGKSEQVEIDDNSDIIEQYFEEIKINKKHHFQLRERLVKNNKLPF